MELVEKNIKIKPFLRWAGGKTWFLKHIDKFLPETINNYYEPFLGGGAVYFHINQKNIIKGHSFLSDSNPHLINTYNVLKTSPDKLIQKLILLENTKERYYLERGKSYSSNIEKAVQFIFLNRTSFNGIYRENLQGIYNVPYGNKSYKELFDIENLKNISTQLKFSKINTFDFYNLKKQILKNDFIFLDPPYTVAHNHNGFVKYNQKIFSWEDQIRLKELVEYIISKGAKFILTNASHESINNLYKGIGKHYFYQRPSVIGGKNAKREIYEEIIITNV